MQCLRRPKTFTVCGISQKYLQCLACVKIFTMHALCQNIYSVWHVPEYLHIYSVWHVPKYLHIYSVWHVKFFTTYLQCMACSKIFTVYVLYQK